MTCNVMRRSLVSGVSTDVDLDLAPGKEPKWTTHSLRRLADTVARRYMELTGTTEDQIDRHLDVTAALERAGVDEGSEGPWGRHVGAARAAARSAAACVAPGLQAKSRRLALPCLALP